MLILDCARCGERRMTHDILAHSSRYDSAKSETFWEFFVRCRSCAWCSIWDIAAMSNMPNPDKLVGQNYALNAQVVIMGVSRARASAIRVPQHTPPSLGKIFEEGAECLAIGCWNAAGAMFRKILDQISKEKLPAENGPKDKRTRFNLKPRLEWLFANGLLPKEIEQFADCVREDANDAVHDHPIGEAEAKDILDFTVEMLERLYTMPGRLTENAARRDARREAAKENPPA